MPTIIISSMGGAGSNNLADTVKLINQDLPDGKEKFCVIGTHFDPYELAKGSCEEVYLVPAADDKEGYVAAHVRLIEKHGVDVLIANSDKEVEVWSGYRDRLACRHTIPSTEQTELVQDKFKFFRVLNKHDCPTVPNVEIKNRESLAAAVAQLPAGDRFWIRLRAGMGSLGATWLSNVEQAEKWVDLWSELRGMKAEEFVLAPFLAGRDFCVSTVWQDGEFCVGKIYERLSYWNAAVSLSAMGSAPLSARTVEETGPIENAKAAIEAINAETGTKPHGFYQCDLKCDEDGLCYVTEVNLGRFPQTSTHFDRVGKHRLLELYLSLLLTPDVKLPRDVHDMDPGKFILRGADMPVRIVEREVLEGLPMA